MRLARILVSGFAASVVTVSCSDDGGSPTTIDPDSAPTTSAAAVAESDGRLTIGLLLPRGANTIGDPMIAAARRAIDEIEGTDVEVRVVEAAEGTNATEAAAGVASLLEDDVDAIVGPSSSTTTLGVLGDIVDAGVLTCSPTATSLMLDDFPDDGLFFRSVASDALQAAAIARLATQTGGQTISIAYLDDRYGRGLLDATREALQAVPIADDITEVPISPTDESLDDRAAAALEPAPDVVVVLADNVEGPRMLAALSAAELPQNGEVPDVFVNDAIRRPASQEAIRRVRTEWREQIRGVSVDAEPDDSELTGNFAANAYDCVAAIALAALAADSDLPTAIASEMVPVSTLGAPCYDYRECADLLADASNIDYQGPVRFELDSRGNISRARFDVFEFNEEGVDTSTGALLIP